MRTFGPYTDLVEIGRGGMATVYRATAPDGGLVALKVLAVHLAADPTARVRFEQESNLGLNHPNVVRVHKAGVEGETPFIEMDYVAGQSLDRLIARHGPLTPRALDPILTDAAAALDYAHDRGVVHRDVKPSNILVRRDGRSLLADFGVAKAADATAFTATRARVGSVFFMSPEQATGSFEITKASDIYSLGVTVYYALTGHLPFEGDNEIAIARQHAERAPRHISDAHPAVPRPVGDVIMRALEKAPGRRPATAGEFAREYARALDAPDVPPPLVIAAMPAAAATTPAPAAAAAAPPTRRMGLPGVLVLIVLLALCLAGLAAAIAAPVVLTPATATPTPTRAAPELTISTATPLPESSGSVLTPLGPTPTSGLITPPPPVNVLPTLPPFPTPFPPPTVAPLPVPTSPPIPTAPIFPTLPPPPAPTPTFVVPTPSTPTAPPPSPTPPPTLPPPPSPTPTTPPPTAPPTLPPPPSPTPPPTLPPPPSPTPTTPPPTPPIVVTIAP